MSSPPANFPEGFLFGCATAALQIEGATTLDGRGCSIWEDFCRDHPNRIQDHASPEPGCDHYRRWEEDLAWIEQLGHNAYRFSLSWPRIQPRRGQLQVGGLDFYDRLVDGLLERNIRPLVTLYHWDLPNYWGTWENPDLIEGFADYAEVCARRLGDRVHSWMTLNEPAWSLMNGYVTGLHPPALHDLGRGFEAAHIQLQAHHAACARLRQQTRGRVGVALNLSPVRCAGSGAKDRRAARWADDFLNQWFLHSCLKGSYPERPRRLLERTLGFAHRIQEPQPLDFLGVNYYYPKWVAAGLQETSFLLNTSGKPEEKCQFSLAGRLRFCHPPGTKTTDWDWEIDPQGLEDLLVDLHEKFPELTLIVTENGLGRREEWGDGELDDRERIDFLAEHLRAVQRARRRGAPVEGYLMWSLMDNFSWLNGYRKRYGLLAVHPETLQRRPKASARWFKEVFHNRHLL